MTIIKFNKRDREKIKASKEQQQKERTEKNNKILRRSVKGFKPFRQWRSLYVKGDWMFEYIDSRTYHIYKKSTILRSYYQVKVIVKNTSTYELLYDKITTVEKAKKLAENHAAENRHKGDV